MSWFTIWLLLIRLSTHNTVTCSWVVLRPICMWQLQCGIWVSQTAASKSIPLASQNGSNKWYLIRSIHGGDSDLKTAISQVPLTLSSKCLPGVAQNYLLGSGFGKEDWHRNDSTMLVDWHSLCLLPQIRTNAIGCDLLPFSTFPPNVQLCGNLFTHQPDLRYPGDEHGKLVTMDLAGNILRGSGIPNIGVFNVFFQAGDGMHVGISDLFWCSQSPGSYLLVSESGDHFSIW